MFFPISWFFGVFVEEKLLISQQITGKPLKVGTRKAVTPRWQLGSRGAVIGLLIFKGLFAIMSVCREQNE